MKQITLLSMAAMAAMSAQAQSQRPNIVYIMTDDHTAQALSAYGKSHIQTPNLDQIAQEGVLFRNSFVANSLSGPSRACMLTGKHSHINGFTNNEHGIFDGSQQTMPKLLQQAGYQTALIGKWHLVSEPTGFDHWDILIGQGEYYNPIFHHQDGSKSVEQGYCTNVITDKAINWMENRDKERPFILFVHHKACHRNWLPELKYLNLYEDKEFPIPETFYDNYEGRPAAQAQEMSIASHHDMDLAYDVKVMDANVTTRLTPNYLAMIGRLDSHERAIYDQFYDSIAIDFRARKLSGNALTEYKYQRYMRDYAKVLKTLDDNVGRTLDYLRDAGLLENTLVVYTSDQGFYMGEHGWFDKRWMYEESFRTPLLVRLPGGAKGESMEMVQNIDYAPTFLEVAGVEVPSDIHGCSFLPVLEGEEWEPNRDGVYYHYYEYPDEHAVKRHLGVRTERYKLIHFYEDGVWELFDLENDKHELNNIYGQPGTEEITAQLKEKLVKLQQQYGEQEFIASEK